MPLQVSPTYQAMLEAVSQTFEMMAFVEITEQSDEIKPEVEKDPVWASILVHDPIQGEIQIALPQTLLTQMAADMFSIEAEEVNENQRRDIIAEILNTLTGLFMANLLPDDQTYQLGLPEQGTGQFPEIEEEATIWNLQIEGLPLVLVATGTGFRS